jgi:ArsR family transcriptional regulator
MAPPVPPRPSSRLPKEHRLDEMQAAMCKTTSNPVRLRILSLLGRGELSVGVIASSLGLSIATISKHLQMMREQGVLASRRKGTTVYYKVADVRILKAVSLIREVLLARLRSTHDMLDGPGRG